MQSIVVALDEPYREWVEEAAGEIKAVTGRKDLPAATRPHFTLHVAERYGDGIDDALSRVAATIDPPAFETGRVGVFRGPSVIVALEVVRTHAIIRFHEQLVAAMAPHADAPKPAYSTTTWAPHISIVAGSIDEEHIDAIMAVLARRDFAWRAPITNICLVPKERAAEWMRFDLRMRGP